MNLSFGIYKKQLLFFLGLFIILGGIFYFISQQLSFASINELAVPGESGALNIDVYLTKDGRVKINDKYYDKYLSINPEYDELRYIAADQSGEYIDNINVYVHLPEPVDETKVKVTDYAVHGVGSNEYYFQDSQTIVYTAGSLSPKATFTIVAQFPKGIFNFSPLKQFSYYLFNLPPLIWLIISIIVPLGAIFVLLFMFRQAFKDLRSRKPKEKSSNPPEVLSASEVEVLVEGRVSARSISATLLDLAQRNYIQVFNKDNEFAFIKKKSVDFAESKSNGLKNFEKVLLSKIFTEEQMKSTLEDVQVRIGRHVFSKKVAEVYLDIYEGITQKGYFLENPTEMHKRYKKFGIILFFIGLIGFIYGVFAAPDPKYYLFFWAAMVFTSFIIIRMSPQLPARTDKGQKAVTEWLKFRNFLIDPTPISYTQGAQGVFERYLPYAIVMECETEWTNRFIEHPFAQPDWFITNKPVVVLEDFANTLFPMVGFVAKELSSAREPIV